MNVEEYMQKIRSSLRTVGARQLYFPMNKNERREGIMRLAREFGYGLSPYSEKEIGDIISSTYGLLVVSNCFDSIGPQIDNATWIKTIRGSLRNASGKDDF